MRYDVEGAQDIATETQAYDAQNIATQFSAATVRSQSGTEAALTTDTRANKATTTGSLANDLYLESDTNWLWRWTGTAWAFVTGLYVATDATRTALTIAAADNGALFYATDTGILWKVEAGVWVNKFSVITATTSFNVGANKVVGARGAAVTSVATADAGAVYDAAAQTLLNEVKAQLNTLLTRLRATGGHGLIAD